MKLYLAIHPLTRPFLLLHQVQIMQCFNELLLNKPILFLLFNSDNYNDAKKRVDTDVDNLECREF